MSRWSCTCCGIERQLLNSKSDCVVKGSTNPGRQVDVENLFCTLAPNICGCSPFLRSEFCGDCWLFRKYVHPWSYEYNVISYSCYKDSSVLIGRLLLIIKAQSQCWTDVRQSRFVRCSVVNWKSQNMMFNFHLAAYRTLTKNTKLWSLCMCIIQSNLSNSKLKGPQKNRIIQELELGKLCSNYKLSRDP
jgi:hypothetical protein